MFNTRGQTVQDVCVSTTKMIDIATLSDLQKQKLQRILEINKPITYGIISVSIGHMPCNVYGRFSTCLNNDLMCGLRMCDRSALHC
jgi:hypothetical protein